MGCDKNNKCTKTGGGKSCKTDADCVPVPEHFWGNFMWRATGEMEQFDAHSVSNSNVNELDKWENTQEDGPVVFYPLLKTEYNLGEPTVKANVPNGIVIWYKDTINDDIHEMIELRDEYVPHCVPANHHDFLTSYVKAYVTPEKLNEVLNVSGSVSYDGLKKLLSARCGSLQANMSTLKTVFDVLNGKVTDYPDNIRNMNQIYESNKIYIKEQLILNRSKYATEINLPYYPGAFNGCPTQG
jgi:hypothetical protein